MKLVNFAISVGLQFVMIEERHIVVLLITLLQKYCKVMIMTKL